MPLYRTLLVALACLGPLAASAQWQWIDNAGRRAFSDQPPPPDIPDRNILRAPASRNLVITPVEPASRPATTAAAPAPAASQGRTDPGQEARRRIAAEEAAELQKRKAEEERVAVLRADNCKRARSGLATIDSGMRIARMNDKGEREIMDDNALIAERRRLEEIIASDCKAP